MGNSEKKEKETEIGTSEQKPKKKWPVVAAIAGGAVLCAALTATIVIMSASHGSGTPMTTGASYTDNGGAAPAESNSSKLSLISREGGHTITDNPFESSSADSSSSSSGESSSDQSSSKGGSSSASSKQEDIRFGDKVSVMGVKMKGKTLAEAYELLQGTVMKMRDPISISVACEGRVLKITEDDFNYQSDLSEVLQEAYHYSRNELPMTTFPTTVKDGVTDFTATCWLDEKGVEAAVKRVTDTYDALPVDAHVTAFDPYAVEKFTYADGHDGFTVDHKLLDTKIREILKKDTKKGSISLEKKRTPYTVTIADVKANTKLIASHYTTAANVYNSNYNMGLALQAASGTVLQPGDIFSFNTMTGDTTNGYTHYYDNGTVGGYLPSTAIVGGKYEQQYGGGICQASTTLYICAMKAGLEAVERYSHAYPSVYCAKGLDATIDYGSLDMRFKNTLKSPVYIATYVYDFDSDGLNELMVEMYGPVSTEYDEVVPVGWVDFAGSYSFSAKAAQVYFKNGKEIKRVFLPSGGYDYKYDSYYSVLSEMPSDTDNGPAVYPTNQVPTVFSPGGCGSSAPIPYGTAEAYLKKIAEDKKKKPTDKKEESSKEESSKEESSKEESSKEESSKQESSKQESSKQESSKQESSKQESSRQESSKQESSRQESSKQESSRQESSKQESSKQESSKQESSKQESSKQESSHQESSEAESSRPTESAEPADDGHSSQES